MARREGDAVCVGAGVSMAVAEGDGARAGGWTAAVTLGGSGGAEMGGGVGAATFAGAMGAEGGSSISRMTGTGPSWRAMVSLATAVPSAPHVGQATADGILPFTGSTSNA